MNKLVRQTRIKRESLSEEYYFQSVLQEAHSSKLLTDSELEAVQLQSIRLLAERTELYTGGESSSVKIEAAQSILQSAFYTMGIYLKSLPDPDASVGELRRRPLPELFRHGRQLTERKMDDAKGLLRLVREGGLETDHRAYNDTIRTGLESFFSAYDPEFAAHETPGMVDYPLSCDKTELTGIEYICNYLQKLYLENTFCGKFGSNDIEGALRGYDMHYQDLLVNIFDIVLANALGRVLLSKNPLGLNIEPEDRRQLREKLEDLPKDRLDAVLEDASSQLCAQLEISDELLREYVSASAIHLSARLKNALENRCLESIFVGIRQKRGQKSVQFVDGKELDGELFRRFVDEIRECRFVSTK